MNSIDRSIIAAGHAAGWVTSHQTNATWAESIAWHRFRAASARAEREETDDPRMREYLRVVACNADAEATAREIASEHWAERRAAAGLVVTRMAAAAE